MLERFRLVEVIGKAAMVQSLRMQFELVARQLPFQGTNRETVRGLAERVRQLALSLGYEKSAHVAWVFCQELDQKGGVPDYSAAVAHMSGLERSLLTDSSAHHFVHIQPDRAKFFPWPRGKNTEPRFGFKPAVDAAFPSALEDINEAGYCLAVEANTAAVYHLMCAVEHGLRALARDRRVHFPKGPIELHQWGEILRELEKKIADINGWTKSLAREAAVEFFNRALKDCRSFNEAYRRHLAHARRHYDRSEALSVMTHVRDFMELLATRISEKKKTPLEWKRP